MDELVVGSYIMKTHIITLLQLNMQYVKMIRIYAILKKWSCEDCNRAKTTNSKIKIDKPDNEDDVVLRENDVVFCSNKDLAIIILKDIENIIVKDLPKVEIIISDDIDDKTKLVSCGYPSITNHNYQPINYDGFEPIDKKFYLNIKADTITNFNCSKDNLSGNSGAGVFVYNNKIAKLIGIYTETGDMGASYGEIIDDSVNDLLKAKGYPLLKFSTNVDGLKIQVQSKFKNCFNIVEHNIDFPEGRDLNLYRLALDGKKYNYQILIDSLLECIPYFTFSRKQIKTGTDNGENVKLIRDSLKKFKDLETQEKLPEVILHGFLEAYGFVAQTYL